MGWRLVTYTKNVPPIQSIENALRIFYSHSELGNKEIKALFGKNSSSTIARLKHYARDEMMRRNVPSYGINNVNTAVAFDVWGIDVADLEKRLQKMKALGLTS